MAKRKTLGRYMDHLWWGGYSQRQKLTQVYMEHLGIQLLRVVASGKEQVDAEEFVKFYCDWQRDAILKELRGVKPRKWPFKERRMHLQTRLLRIRMLRLRCASIINDVRVGQ